MAPPQSVMILFNEFCISGGGTAGTAARPTDHRYDACSRYNTATYNAGPTDTATTDGDTHKDTASACDDSPTEERSCFNGKCLVGFNSCDINGSCKNLTNMLIADSVCDVIRYLNWKRIPSLTPST